MVSSPAMTRKTSTSKLVHRGAFVSAVILSAVLALPATADWLVTLEGQLVETQGSWKVDGDAVVYVGTDGEERRMAVAEVDLEGSADTTEVRTGRRPELPAPPPPPAPEAEEKKDVQAEERPDVILYATSWCGYCRKTRQLLKELEADFVEKDIEKDPAAGREFRQRFGRSGVPVIDVGGQVIRGYDHQMIREAVRALQRQDADG